MAKLAIKGHPTRGKEVIEILEMLGGLNKFQLEGNPIGTTMEQNYVIDDGIIVLLGFDKNRTIFHGWEVFTLEDFLEKFPYKVGDRVSSKYLKNYKIEKMEWEDTNNRVIYKLQGMGWYSVDELQPYKEETMEKKISGAIIDRFICLEGYEFYDDKGNIIDTKEITMKKKTSKYPKTHKECCAVLGIEEDLWFVYEDIDANHINPACISNYRMRGLDLYHNLEFLKIYRDAYWKIAGDWKEKRKGKAIHYVICSTLLGEVVIDTMPNCIANYFLDFPTEEMRDAFYENFKELIEECKELL